MSYSAATTACAATIRWGAWKALQRVLPGAAAPYTRAFISEPALKGPTPVMLTAVPES
jgi:hypothetical protein